MPHKDAAEAERFFLHHLAEVERAVAFACHRGGISRSDAEDVASDVKLKLIENDYAAVRMYEGRCSFVNYVIVIVQRLLLDRRNQQYGKWHPSANAKRLGMEAVLAEKLLVRDHKTLDETLVMLRQAGHVITARQLEEWALQFSERRARPREVELAEADSATVAEGVERNAIRGEMQRVVSILTDVVRKAMKGFSKQDRALIVMRYGASMSVAEIARALRIDQKPIYRRIAGRLVEIRRALVENGLRVDDIRDVLETGWADIDFELELHEGEDLSVSVNRSAAMENDTP